MIAVTAAQRIPQLPGAPTLIEQGIDVEGGNWFGLMGPARMQQDAVRRVAATTADAVRSPAVLELFRTQVAEPTSSTPEAMRSFIAEDRERWGEVIRALGVQLE